MPDYGYIAQPVQQNAFQKIGEAISAARAAQAFQRERQTFEADVERAKAESSRAGTEASVAAQTAPTRVAQQAAQTRTAETTASRTQWAFDAEQATKLYEVAAGVAQDPAVVRGDSAGSVQALMRAEEQARAMRIPEDKIRVQFSPLYNLAGNKPEALRQVLDNIVRGASGAQTQAGVINAPMTPIGTAQGTVFAQTQPGAANAVVPVGAGGGAQPQQGTMIPAGVAPAATEQQGADALGRPVIVKRDPQSGAISYAPPPGSNYKPMMTLPAGETPETARPLLALRDQSQAAAAKVPEQRFYNREIINLADSAFTGTGSEQLAKLLNAVAIQKTNDAGADTAKLQHFIARQVEQNAAAQGANTDAARQLAERAVTPGSTPAQALKAVTRVNDAYATGVELFNRAMQATLQNPNNQKDVFAIRDLQNAWAANLDPRIFMLENAAKAGDQKTIADIKKQLGEAGVRELLGKARALNALTQRGAVGNGP